MRLTQLTDYAMRLLIYLAQRPERLCTIAEVAGSYCISHTLANILPAAAHVIHLQRPPPACRA